MGGITMNLRIPARPGPLFPSDPLAVERPYEGGNNLHLRAASILARENFRIRNRHFEKKRCRLAPCVPGLVAVRQDLRFEPPAVARSGRLRREHRVGPDAGCPGEDAASGVTVFVTVGVKPCQGTLPGRLRRVRPMSVESGAGRRGLLQVEYVPVGIAEDGHGGAPGLRFGRSQEANPRSRQITMGRLDVGDPKTDPGLSPHQILPGFHQTELDRSQIEGHVAVIRIHPAHRKPETIPIEIGRASEVPHVDEDRAEF